MTASRQIDALGPRICIMGPSNSGKSTLAAAIGQARGLPPVHLDQLYHQPNTDWAPRPREEFIALHDRAILDAAWVMDGNYTQCLPQRLARATGFILLDTASATSLLRYLRRCWFERDRLGALEGGRDSVKWEMIHFIAVTTRRNRRRWRRMFDDVGLPKIRLGSMKAIARFYRVEGLRR